MSANVISLPMVRALCSPGVEPVGTFEFLAVGEVDNTGTEARIHLAAPLSIEEIARVARERIEIVEEVHWDSREEAVVARRATRLGAIVLAEQPFPLNGDKIADAMIEGVRELGLAALPWNSAATSLRSRSEWLRKSGLAGNDWPDLSDATLVESLDRWLSPFLDGVTRKEHLSHLDLTRILSSLLSLSQRSTLEQLAPASLSTPSGSKVTLQYGNERQPVMPVRLQEMFGQMESPTVGAELSTS